MSPKINFENIGDLQDYRWSVSKINSIDPETDTCKIVPIPKEGEEEPEYDSDAGETALIFYH